MAAGRTNDDMRRAGEKYGHILGGLNPFDSSSDKLYTDRGCLIVSLECGELQQRDGNRLNLSCVRYQQTSPKIQGTYQLYLALGIRSVHDNYVVVAPPKV
jgi:hypothetical protein